jgi:predicted transcriptional regulator
MSKRQALSKREQQIMDILFEVQRATAHEVLERLADPPSYSAVRALLAVMERKGFVRHEQDGQRYLYAATQSSEKAGKRALSHLVDVFFGGSASKAVASLLDSEKLDAAEIARLEALIARAKKEDR